MSRLDVFHCRRLWLHVLVAARRSSQFHHQLPNVVHIAQVSVLRDVDLACHLFTRDAARVVIIENRRHDSSFKAADGDWTHLEKSLISHLWATGKGLGSSDLLANRAESYDELVWQIFEPKNTVSRTLYTKAPSATMLVEAEWQ